MPLPVYVINLDRRPDRWKHISSHLERVGVEAERVSAVDAKLPAHKEEWEAYVNRNHDKFAFTMHLGAVACALSHAKTLERFLGSGHPAALILEDDAEVATDTASLLHSTDWWPKGTRIVRLEAGGGFSAKWQDYAPLWDASGRTPSGRELRRMERRSCGSAAYLINREGAEIVLGALKRPNLPMDHILFNLRYARTARKLRPVQVLPAMAKRRYGSADSDLTDWDSTKSKRSHRTFRRYKRTLLSIPYRIRYSALTRLRKIRKVSVPYRDSP